MSAKIRLKERIKRFLGYPMVKIELDDSQIYDNIEFARRQFIRWAVGNATQESFFTVMLSGGQNLYDMPGDVVEVVEYDTLISEYGGINTLFTIENYLYNQGMYAILQDNSGFGLISYHMALDFLQNLKRYAPDSFSFRYHKHTNQLEIIPTPLTGNSLTYTNENNVSITVDSPGWILVRAFVIEGGSGDDGGLYNEMWVEQYAKALCKITLGHIRRKFANSTLLGNQGTALDGDSLVSEGITEKDALEESIRQREAYTGYGIYIG
jgi:hypothetical protein